MNQKESNSVFRDLGFEPAEAANLELRAELMLEIEHLIRDRQLTQVEAAKLFGVAQPRISNLLNGKIGLFSVDKLVNMLALAGRRVELTVTVRDPERSRGTAPSRSRRAWGSPRRRL